MALTPDDVVKKEFSKPKAFGRSGYDETQVDDFLDEVVVELRRLTAANDDLSDKLEDCRRGKQPVSAAGGAPVEAKSQTPSAAASVPALTPVKKSADSDAAGDKDKQIAALKAERDSAREDLAKAQARIEELEKQATAGEPTAEDHAAALSGGGAGATDAASVIALAQRVHDQHIKEGETERDRLVSEAKTHHDKVIGEANAKSEELISTATQKNKELISSGQAKHDELVASGQKQHDDFVAKGKEQSAKLLSDAEEKRTSVLTDLDGRRAALNAEIEKLKKFESDYRSNLKGYFNEQLRQLDQKSAAPVTEDKNS